MSASTFRNTPVMARKKTLVPHLTTTGAWTLRPANELDFSSLRVQQLINNLPQPGQPPAPPLVGVELNPGPPGRLSEIAALGAALGSALAKTKKKKKTTPVATTTRRKKVSIASSAARSNDQLTKARGLYVTAPNQVGRILSSTVRHMPFVVSGHNRMCSLRTNTLGAPILYGSGNAAMTGNVGNIDPAGQGATTTNFFFFPGVVSFNLINCFLRYRIRKLVLEYVPTSSTATPANVAIATSPEVFTTITSVLMDIVQSCENNICTPVWAPASFDALGPGGLRKDWLFVDSTNTVSEAIERQEQAGSLLFALGGSPGVSAYLGDIWASWELEFDGLGLQANISRATATPADESTSSPPLPPVRPRPDHPSPAHASPQQTPVPPLNHEGYYMVGGQPGLAVPPRL